MHYLTYLKSQTFQITYLTYLKSFLPGEHRQNINNVKKSPKTYLQRFFKFLKDRIRRECKQNLVPQVAVFTYDLENSTLKRVIAKHLQYENKTLQGH